jgi:hypothetical protein
MIWAGHVAHVGRKGYSCRAFVSKPGSKNHFKDLGVDGDNIQMDLKEIEWDGVYWIYQP